MRTLYDGPVFIAYGQAYVQGPPVSAMDVAFAGQANGLCGAAFPGALFLVTGTRDGDVRFTVELHDAEPPPAGPEWQEVVEVSFRPTTETVDLVPWADAAVATLFRFPGDGPATTYRVRYCATAMDEGNDPWGGHDPDDDPADLFDDRPDRYQLLFWPSPGEPAPDVIVRQTSEIAAYWHGSVPAQPWEPSAQELAAVEEYKRSDQYRRDQELLALGHDAGRVMDQMRGHGKLPGSFGEPPS
ncbi:hypothetical protein KOI35_37890 [Actinoplanes bogorensis]|uniref:Uncharacterized protein n=1 Tax=Paractinoplanes bogorensis TaxID=1610840 RepID=A0ABS5Z4F1_9ACTN|nr:hypothetical protein [Actinoplanes bogorensis]MBU2669300.1 hypothetical protein [Actinoplanes bogorensis]